MIPGPPAVPVVKSTRAEPAVVYRPRCVAVPSLLKVMSTVVGDCGSNVSVVGPTERELRATLRLRGQSSALRFGGGDLRLSWFQGSHRGCSGRAGGFASTSCGEYRNCDHGWPA
jgi:hypothetical protein